MIAGKEFGERRDHFFIIDRALDLDTLALPTLPVMIQTLTTAVQTGNMPPLTASFLARVG